MSDRSSTPHTLGGLVGGQLGSMVGARAGIRGGHWLGSKLSPKHALPVGVVASAIGALGGALTGGHVGRSAGEAITKLLGTRLDHHEDEAKHAALAEHGLSKTALPNVGALLNSGANMARRAYTAAGPTGQAAIRGAGLGAATGAAGTFLRGGSAGDVAQNAAMGGAVGAGGGALAHRGGAAMQQSANAQHFVQSGGAGQQRGVAGFGAGGQGAGLGGQRVALPGGRMPAGPLTPMGQAPPGYNPLRQGQPRYAAWNQATLSAYGIA